MVQAAIAQICSTAHPSQNLAQCISAISIAAKQGAKVVFFPEASDYIAAPPHTTQSLCRSVETSEFVVGLRECARREKVWVNVGVHEPGLSGSASSRDAETDNANDGPGNTTQAADDLNATFPARVRNTLIWIDDKGQLLDAARYTKLHLFNLDLPPSNTHPNGLRMLESNTTEPGTSLTPPLVTPVGKVGSQICFDLRFPEPGLALRRMGAEVLVYPSAFTVPTGKLVWEVLLRARAVENQCYVVAAAQCGRHSGGGDVDVGVGDGKGGKKRSGRVSYGDAMVVGPRGEVVVRCGRVEDEEAEELWDGKGKGRTPEVKLFEVDLELVEKVRREVPLDRRRDVYGVV